MRTLCDKKYERGKSQPEIPSLESSLDRYLIDVCEIVSTNRKHCEAGREKILRRLTKIGAQNNILSGTRKERSN